MEPVSDVRQSDIRLIEGQPVLLVIDIQQGSFDPAMPGIPGMPGYANRMQAAANLVKAARGLDIPIIFFQEAHRPNLVDFGRELDGQEGIHCLETDARTAIATEVDMRPDDYFIRKRRYSCFFGTDLEILLKGLKANTLILIGGLTDVCVHYTFVDGHQHDYYCRVVEDCVAGSSEMAHESALRAMEYLQRRARCSASEVLAALTPKASMNTAENSAPTASVQEVVS
ncbi:MAG: isochorismatase family cysteine hydrolase [Cyanobacteria bacterium J06632_3]